MVGGSAYTNPWFASDWSGAGSVGLFRGAYHFARPALPLTTAAVQASTFVSVAGTMGGSHDLAPVLDLEVTGGLSPGRPDRLDLHLAEHRAQPDRAGAHGVHEPQLLGHGHGRHHQPVGLPAVGGLLDDGLEPDRHAPAGAPTGTSGSTPTPAPSPASPAGPTSAGSTAPGSALEALAGAEVATTGPVLYLRNSVSTGVADASYRFGTPSGGTTLMCDWDGNGTDTPGVFVNGVWWITNATTGSFAQNVFGYGQPGDIPVCGDWDGNGTDTPGIVRGGMWYLTNTLGSPFADVHFAFGNGGDTPGGGRLGRQRHRHPRGGARRHVVPHQLVGDGAGRRVLRLRQPDRHPRRRGLEQRRARHARAWCGPASGTWSAAWPIPTPTTASPTATPATSPSPDAGRPASLPPSASPASSSGSGSAGQERTTPTVDGAPGLQCPATG